MIDLNLCMPVLFPGLLHFLYKNINPVIDFFVRHLVYTFKYLTKSSTVINGCVNDMIVIHGHILSHIYY